MFSLKALTILALGALPAVRGASFDVIVGGPNGLKYTPESVTAQPGDIVRFIFQTKNHTATQSTFDAPCVKAPNGFDSGFIPVADTQTEFQVAEFNVATTDPVWVYCKQGTHCAAGMVFAVNPGAKMAEFKAKAAGATATATSTSASTTATTTGTGTTTAPSTTATKDIKVIVGGPGALTFNPSNVQANIGDNIVFEFHQKNHAVVASSFDAPCVPLSQSVPASLGFDSGFFPVADTATTFPTYTVRVNDTKPVWAYCPQGNHCGQGMVFSVNAVEGSAKSFQAFQDLAKQINGTAASGTAGGYGNGGFQPTINGASAAIAAILAIVALL
ncbi:hypothetical protein D9611_004586 [Ephemerocybe angulata]|uniref:Cupredoxin n=1 Tax=Ephemerocybe angulata TaxID=980116 RepID=A0A8H5BKP7_9AGAR|nr:hypothetical protein D9611_004586 [Tulosesus angulatus]